MDMEYKDAPGEARSTRSLSLHSRSIAGSKRPKKPCEIPQPGKEPETTSAEEREPDVWPRKQPEIQPGKEPLTSPPGAPLEVPEPPESLTQR